MSGQTGVLRYRTEETISMPYCIELWHGVLHWRAEYNFQSQVQGWEKRPVADCLEDFLSLVNASDDQVLAFTQRRGVLGVFPAVARESEENASASLEFVADHRQWQPWMCGQAAYIEDPRIYRRMARVAGYMLRAMKFVREGVRIDPKQTEAFRRSLASSSQWFGVDTQEQAYRGVQKILGEWSNVAGVSLGLWQHERLDGGQEIKVNFAVWEDGQQWDQKAEDGPGFEVSEYLSEASSFLSAFPHGARPSPLFNVLFFQLLQKVSLPEGSYFCAQCGGFYTYTEEGRRDKEMTKPRNGRPVSFCKEECRKVYRQAFERKWKRDHRPKP